MVTKQGVSFGLGIGKKATVLCPVSSGHDIKCSIKPKAARLCYRQT